MRSLTLTSVITLAASLNGMANIDAKHAQASIVSQSWTITNNSDEDATDFHIEITGTGKVSHGPSLKFDKGGFPDASFGPVGIDQPPPNEANWLPGNADPLPYVARGQTIHIGLEFDSEVDMSDILKAYWTRNDGQTSGKQPKLPGFRADPRETGALADGFRYTVINHMDTELTITDLQFRISSDRTPLELLLPYTLPGFGPSQPTFTLASGASETFDVTGSGNYLLAQLTSFPTSDPSDVSMTMHQHETPEPSTLAMTGISALGLLVYVRRRRRA